MSTVQLITEQGKFEADTVEAVAKMLRKAKSEERKRNIAAAADGTLAVTRASANAYEVLRRFLVVGKPPSGWRYYEAGHKYGPHLREHRDCSERLYHEALYETPDGSVWNDYYGYRVLGHVWNGSGHTLCIFIEDNAREGEVTCLSPGIAGDQLRTVELPGITAEWFARDTNEGTVT